MLHLFHVLQLGNQFSVFLQCHLSFCWVFWTIHFSMQLSAGETWATLYRASRGSTPDFYTAPSSTASLCLQSRYEEICSRSWLNTQVLTSGCAALKPEEKCFVISGHRDCLSLQFDGTSTSLVLGQQLCEMLSSGTSQSFSHSSKLCRSAVQMAEVNSL